MAMRDSGMVMSDVGVGVNLAGLGGRFVALLIDGIILFVVGVVLGLIFGDGPGEAGIGSILNLVVSAAYYIYFINQTGMTLGGRVMGVKVVDVSGNLLSVGGAAIRWVGALISG